MRRACAILGLVLAAPLLTAEEPKNPIFRELTGKGFTLPDGTQVKLAAPIFPVGPAPQDFDALVKKGAGKRPLDLFRRRTPGAPHFLEISSIDDAAGVRCAQLIDLRFMAYGSLDKVKDSDVFKDLISNDKAKGKNVKLKPAELRQRNIKLLQDPDFKEQYNRTSFALIEKVQIDGVLHSLQCSGDDWVLSASRMDNRFLNDAKYPNIWRHLQASAGGQKKGPSNPYGGMAGYVLVTRLPRPKDALFIEMKYILYEPKAWFGPNNLLRSKLPIAIRDNVQKFRRNLTED